MKNSAKTELVVSNKTVLRVMAVVILSLLFLAAVRQAAQALLLIFIAFFLALALNAPVQWMAGHLPGKSRGSRALGVGASFLVVVLALGLFLASVVPALSRQTGNFIDAVPGFIQDLDDENSTVGELVHRYGLQEYIDDLSAEARNRISSFGGTAFTAASRVGANLVSLITVLVLTVMMLIEGPRWVAFSKRLIPKAHHGRAERLMTNMYRVIKGFVNGQVILASLAAVFILPPLFIMGVSYPLALAVGVFILGLIPLIGNWLSAALLTIVALFTSPIAAIVILVYFVIYQQIDNYLVQPNIQANTTNLTPLMVFASVILGVNFAGIVGGLLAIPIAGCLRVVALEYLNNRHLLKKEQAK